MATINASDYAFEDSIPLGTLITGNSDVLSARHSRDLTIYLTMTGSPNDTFVVESSPDGTSKWGNMDADNGVIQIWNAGTEPIRFDGDCPNYVRVRKVSGTGSADLTVTLGAVS